MKEDHILGGPGSGGGPAGAGSVRTARTSPGVSITLASSESSPRRANSGLGLAASEGESEDGSHAHGHRQHLHHHHAHPSRMHAHGAPPSLGSEEGSESNHHSHPPEDDGLRHEDHSGGAGVGTRHENPLQLEPLRQLLAESLRYVEVGDPLICQLISQSLFGGWSLTVNAFGFFLARAPSPKCPI